MLNGIIFRLQNNLRKQLNSLGKEFALEWKSELRDLSLDLDVKLTSKRIDQLINLILWIFFSAIQSPVGNEVGGWTIGEVFLSTSSLDNNSDAE